MLSEKENAFINHWKEVREYENTFGRKMVSGLPMALIFCLPILLFIVVVYVFFPDWFAKLSHISAGTFATILLAVLIATLFYSYFRMHFKWEMNEQLYKELIGRKGDDDSSEINH